MFLSRGLIAFSIPLHVLESERLQPADVPSVNRIILLGTSGLFPTCLRTSTDYMNRRFGHLITSARVGCRTREEPHYRKADAFESRELLANYLYIQGIWRTRARRYLRGQRV